MQLHHARFTAFVLVVGVVIASLLLLQPGQSPAQAPPQAAADGPAIPFDPTPKPAVKPADGKLRIIAFGAHPDDCEIRIGGAAAKWAALGHHVKFVSLTNGDIGHWQSAGGPLAQRRLVEVQHADKLLGVETEVLDIHDDELMPDLETRRKVVRLIREWKADLVLCHRPYDYHPDHRNTGLVVQDAAYMVTVPYFCPDVPYLEANPVFMYYWDRFEKPYPFTPDVAVDIDDVIDKKLQALVLMESQFVEGGCCPPVKKMPADRMKARLDVRNYFAGRFVAAADQYRERLIADYGEERGKAVRHAEAFEVCEYGRQPNAEELRKLFPFVGR